MAYIKITPMKPLTNKKITTKKHLTNKKITAKKPLTKKTNGPASKVPIVPKGKKMLFFAKFFSETFANSSCQRHLVLRRDMMRAYSQACKREGVEQASSDMIGKYVTSLGHRLKIELQDSGKGYPGMVWQNAPPWSTVAYKGDRVKDGYEVPSVLPQEWETVDYLVLHACALENIIGEWGWSFQ